METIKFLLLKLKGKWKYDDGRVIEFFEDGECELTPRNGKGPKVKGKFIFSSENDKTITFSTPFMEAKCLFESLDSKKFSYYDIKLDGQKIQRILTKVK